MYNPLEIMHERHIPILLSRYSALERYFGVEWNTNTYILAEAELPEIAVLFDTIQYSKLPFADAFLKTERGRYIITCVESFKNTEPQPFPVLELFYNPFTEVYFDPKNIYPFLRSGKLRIRNHNFPDWLIIFEAAKLISRLPYEADNELMDSVSWNLEPTVESQKDLLLEILAGRYPHRGFELLLKSGFIESFWPEIFRMTKTEHSKDYHPEGNVWEHTMEALKYRKHFNPELSVALLLHDVGKAFSQEIGQKRFFGHSEVGARKAEKFLLRLGFNSLFISNVKFLIKYHMLPYALKELPLYRTKDLMGSPLFPLLLDIYRADTSASFKDLEGYYEACRIYRGFLKDQKKYENAYYL